MYMGKWYTNNRQIKSANFIETNHQTESYQLYGSSCNTCNYEQGNTVTLHVHVHMKLLRKTCSTYIPSNSQSCDTNAHSCEETRRLVLSPDLYLHPPPSPTKKHYHFTGLGMKLEQGMLSHRPPSSPFHERD